jgi:hypothetical protein
MGNFYVNYTLRGPAQKEIAAALEGRTARVTPEHNGCVVAFDELSDRQDTDEISSLAEKLSDQFGCPVLAVLNHDDDILWYQLYLSGTLADEYNSSPGYFEATEPSPPEGGSAEKLAEVFGGEVEAIDKVLRKSSFEADGYVFAVDRHADLVKALGISDHAVGTAYASFDHDELPEGLSAESVLNVSSPESAERKQPSRMGAHVGGRIAADPPLVLELFTAAASNNAATVRRIIEQDGLSPETLLSNGNTPLHVACSSGALDAATTLLDLGADPNRRYDFQLGPGAPAMTSLTAIIYARNAPIVQLLLRHGADPNAADSNGMTAMMSAATRGDAESVEALLAAGADPLATGVPFGQPNTARRTALQFAQQQLNVFKSLPQTPQFQTPQFAEFMAKTQRVVDLLTVAEEKTRGS